MHNRISGPGTSRLRTLAALLLTWGIAPTAAAMNGTGDDRVVLPDGPGSIQGFGDSAQVLGNMGFFSHEIPLSVPRGQGATTPALNLAYSSGAGNSWVGIGWDLHLPFMERSTFYGVPRYDTSDVITADGGNELVELPGTTPPTYRQRFEKSFIRYQWLDRGAGGGGYWRAETPEGLIHYFGADANGVEDPSARVGGASGVFRYLLVETRDLLGHRVRYRWTPSGTSAVLHSVEYVHDGDGQPTRRVELTTAVRPDFISNCAGGFEETLQHRLERITMYLDGQVARSYQLIYETVEQSGGLSRLREVREFGTDGTQSPQTYLLEYSRALGGVCTSADCGQPFLVSMGSLGVSLATGGVALIDMNGDALPDVVDTYTTGPHRIFLSQLTAGGSHTFAAPLFSTVGDSSGHRMGSGIVQPMDVNGDGFVDLLNASTGTVLYNLGGGDWASAGDLAGNGTEGLPDFQGDSDGTNLRTIRFLDVDNDRRVDVFRAASGTSVVHRNTPDGFVEEPPQPLDVDFVAQRVELEDMNGDGMLDVIIRDLETLRYRINLGRGSWTDWREIVGLPITQANLSLVDMEDINGDGLADLVTVMGNEVRYALNRNGRAFDAEQVITQAAGGTIPNRTNMTVLFSDMNANGSDDVVWIDATGNVTYLELFPVRPNLLSRVENSLGAVIDVSYGSGVQELARDGTWAHRIPHSTLVVKSLDVWDRLTGVHDLANHSYSNAYYDGAVKQFRGFETVVVEREDEPSQEGGVVQQDFDVGVSDRYRAGLLLKQATSSGGRDIHERTTTWSDCTLSGVPDSGLRVPVRFMCRTAVSTIIKEGQPAANWVTTEEQWTHDGYGNAIRHAQLGVTSRGGSDCAPCANGRTGNGAPCGPQCQFDEQVLETEFIPPAANGPWLLRLPQRMRMHDGRGGAEADQHFYYDGPAFVGLASGSVTTGQLTRITQRVSADSPRVIDTMRVERDSHGNIIRSIHANDDPASPTHAESSEYDSTGLHLLREVQDLQDEDGTPYSLRREFQYDPYLDLVVESTDWMLVQGGTISSPRNSTFHTYDGLGRVLSTVLPGGDSLASPTITYTHEMASPVSRVLMQVRASPGETTLEEHVQCLDGFGRVFQERRKLPDGTWHVGGFTVFNRRGQEVEVHQPYAAPDGQCAMAAPTGGAITYLYDATDRLLQQQEPDGEQYGSPSVRRWRYEPLTRIEQDEANTDSQGPASGLSTTYHQDGLGRVVAVERPLDLTAAPPTFTFEYDSLGHLSIVQDPQGNARVQEHDLLGRVLRVVDPDSGERVQVFDDDGQVIRATDGRGRTTRYVYDGMHRLTAEWEDGQEATNRISYQYDRPGACSASQCTNVAGRLASVTYPTRTGLGLDRFGYNARGESIFSDRVLDGIHLVVDEDVDTLGRLRHAVYPGGIELNYAHDALGRLTSVGGVVDALAYDSRGLLDRADFNNGIRTTRTFDSRMRFAGSTTGRPAGASLHQAAYSWGRHDRLLASTNVVGGAQSDSTYSYDAWHRLVDTSTTRAGNTEHITLQFDALNNILSQTSSVTSSPANVGSYSYDASRPRAVASAGDTTYAYDGSGLMTQRGATSLTWDFKGRLTDVTLGTQSVLQVDYGPGYHRVRKQDASSHVLYAARDVAVRDGVVQVDVVIPNVATVRLESLALQHVVLPDVAPAQVQDGSATPQPDATINAADAWIAAAAQAGVFSLAGADTADVRTLLRASARRMLHGTGPVRVTYLHTNHQHSVVAATDASGALLGVTEFHPFGQVQSSTLTAPEDVRWTGHERDATGLYAFGARYLDADVGRWTAPDPLYAVADANLFSSLGDGTAVYAYVENDPVGRVDEEGFTSHWVQEFQVMTYSDSMARAKTGDQLTGDHVPSFAAVAFHVEKNVVKRALTSTERRKLRNKLPTVIMKHVLHAAGRTYGGKNTKAQIASDGASFTSLVGAIKQDFKRYENLVTQKQKRQKLLAAKRQITKLQKTTLTDANLKKMIK